MILEFNLGVTGKGLSFKLMIEKYLFFGSVRGRFCERLPNLTPFLHSISNRTFKGELRRRRNSGNISRGSYRHFGGSSENIFL